MKRRWLFCGLVHLAVITTSGCGWLDDPSPEFVRVMIESDDDSLMLITSTQFFQTTNELGEVGVQLLDSDTTTIASFPFDQTWDISAEQRFLLMGFPADSGAVTAHLRILLDGDPDYDRTVTVLIDNPVRYIYLFNQRILQEFELL